MQLYKYMPNKELWRPYNSVLDNLSWKDTITEFFGARYSIISDHLVRE